MRDDEGSGDREFHPGLDIANASGTPIRATADGIVARARRSGGYGNLVMLRHDLGYATLYGHASSLLVKEGELVKRGQVIAAMGSTGRSTGSHVHYEVWFNGRTVNPAKFLKESGTKEAGPWPRRGRRWPRPCRSRPGPRGSWP